MFCTSRSAASRLEAPGAAFSRRPVNRATSHSASRSIVWPTARVIFTMVSKSRRPSRSILATRTRASASTSLNATSSPASGKPRARQSRWACWTESPDGPAISSPVSSGTAPMMARSRSSGAVIGPAVDRVVRLVDQVVEDQLDLFHARDVVELDTTCLAGVGDDKRAAPEDPVDQALLVGDVADPGQ